MTAKAEMDFDAIKYSYTVKSCSGNPIVAGAALIDSHEGEILITAEGCRRTELLNIEMSAAVTNSWQNEVDSIEMNILGRCNDLRRTIPCPYWYAKSGNPPDCCYSNAAEYEFTLKADGCDGHVKAATVSLPSSDLLGEAIPISIDKPEVVEASRVEVDIGNHSGFRVEFEFGKYAVRYMARSEASSQYRGKIFGEELVHKNQLERVPDYEFEDAFSIADVKQLLGIPANAAYVVVSDDENVISLALLACRNAINREYDNSMQYYVDNHDYREWKAKNSVRYNEAYKYHCCYERFGAKAAPVSKVKKNR